MRKSRFSLSLGVKGLSLAMILSSSLIPAHGRTITKSSFHPAAPGAIGIIQSSGAVSINGHPANGAFTLWGDELVQATAEAKIVFGALGEVKLAAGGSLQLKMENAKLHEAAGTQAFSAALLAGTMNVKLMSDTGALVNSTDSEFAAARGANFKVDLKAGKATLSTANGTVLANSLATTKRGVESKINPTTTTKDAQFLAAKKLEKLIGNFQVKAPSAVIAEAARREKAMDDIVNKRAAFMRSLSITSSSAFMNSSTAQPTKAFTNTIGAAESLRGVIVNGKIVAGREMLWGGEILEAPQGSGARVMFNSIGQLLLNSGAKAKVTMETVGAHSVDAVPQKVLAAQLLSGDAFLKFDANASGYVRAGDSVMAGSRGAQFRVEMREGNGAVNVSEGSVMVIGNWPVAPPAMVRDAISGKIKLESKSYNIRPANLTSYIPVTVNSSRNIAMRVTDEKNRPVADVPVKFTLAGAGSLGANIFGVNSIEIRTDAKGIATIPYNASATAGNATVRAEVPGTNATTTTTAAVTTQEANFFSWHGGFPAVVAAAAAIGIGAGFWMTRQDRLPIKGTGDAVVIP